MNSESAFAQFPQHSRVKIYLCVQDGSWVDYVIGFLQIITDEEQGCSYLRVYEQSLLYTWNDLSEETRRKLVVNNERNCSRLKWAMNLRILNDVKYERQGDNIITWFEPEIQEDLAISFIDTQFTKDIHLQLIQGKKSAVTQFKEMEQIIIPTHQNLDTFFTQIQEHPDNVIQQMISKQSYLENLKQVFEEVEELQNEHNLETLYHIFRCLIYLKNEQILLLLMSDQYYLTTFGVLECNNWYEYHLQRILDHADNRGKLKVSYRNFLINQSKFHLVLESLDEQIIHQIHLSYRLNYLRESVMAYYLYIEDPTYNFISLVKEKFSQIFLEGDFVKQLENCRSTSYNTLRGFCEVLIDQILRGPLAISGFLERILFKFQIAIILDCNLCYYNIFQKQEIKDLFFKCAFKSKFLVVLQESIKSVIDNLQSNPEQQAFLCYTMMSIQLMFLNVDANYFVNFLLENLQVQQLFWNNIGELILSDQIATQQIIIDFLMILFPPQQIIQQQQQMYQNTSVNHHLLLPKFIQFLYSLIMPPMQINQKPRFGINCYPVYSMILLNIGDYQGLSDNDLLQLSVPVLDFLKFTNQNKITSIEKQSMIAALKLLKFLIIKQNNEVDFFLKTRGYLFLLFRLDFGKRSEGVIDGIFRECIKYLSRNSSLKYFMCQMISKDDSVRSNPKFEGVFMNYLKNENDQKEPEDLVHEEDKHQVEEKNVEKLNIQQVEQVMWDNQQQRADLIQKEIKKKSFETKDQEKKLINMNGEDKKQVQQKDQIDDEEEYELSEKIEKKVKRNPE